ncbi:putative dynamin central domain, GTPase effector domain, Dynamin superfamily [Helianthus annuus]|nr:putative dynamin central domain, GTPase effector domain, Dynamin superfamily [Helianthus annuus]
MEAELDHLGGPIAIDAGLPGALRKPPFDKHLSLQNVRKLVSEADGYQPHLIAPEQGYRRLFEGSLNYFRGTAEASVDAVCSFFTTGFHSNGLYMDKCLYLMCTLLGNHSSRVHFVLKELVRKSIGETEELRRFPTLQSALAAVAGEALEKFRDESKKTVVRLVEMESSYLTVDFFRKLPQEGEKMGPTPSPGDCRTSSADRRNPPGSDRGVPGADRVIPSDPLLDQYAEAHFRRIGSNVSSIGMVSDTLRSTIPKAVIYCQVKEAKQNLLSYFYTQIGRREGKQLAELLDEDPSLMSKRQEIAKRLELYKAARDEIYAVGAIVMNFWYENTYVTPLTRFFLVVELAYHVALLWF